MPGFIGGSAHAMAHQVEGGFVALTPVRLKRLTGKELTDFQFELEKLVKMARAELPDPQDSVALQERNRRIMRVSGGLRVVTAFIAARRRGRV